MMFPILPAYIKFKDCNEEILTNVVLDNCSSGCWMLDSLVPDAVPVKEAKVNISTIEATNKSTVCNFITQVSIESLNRSCKFEIPVVYTRNNESWPFSAKDIPSYKMIDNYEHLKNLPFNFCDKPVTLLIGMNMPSILCPQEIVQRRPNEPFASLHTLGWALNGPVEGKSRLLCNRIKSNLHIH